MQVAQKPDFYRVLVVLYFVWCNSLELVYYVAFQQSTVTQRLSWAEESTIYVIIDVLARIVNPSILATLITVSHEGAQSQTSLARSQVRSACTFTAMRCLRSG